MCGKKKKLSYRNRQEIRFLNCLKLVHDLISTGKLFQSFEVRKIKELEYLVVREKETEKL